MVAQLPRRGPDFPPHQRSRATHDREDGEQAPSRRHQLTGGPQDLGDAVGHDRQIDDDGIGPVEVEDFEPAWRCGYRGERLQRRLPRQTETVAEREGGGYVGGVVDPREARLELGPAAGGLEGQLSSVQIPAALGDPVVGVGCHPVGEGPSSPLPDFAPEAPADGIVGVEGG